MSVTISNPVALGLLPGGSYSIAQCANSDGSVIGGLAGAAGGVQHAFLWFGAGLIDIGVLPGETQSAVLGLSGDGTIAVGVSGNKGFKWTLAGGMVDIGTAAAFAGGTVALTCISGDGSTFAGVGVTAAGFSHLITSTGTGITDQGQGPGPSGSGAMAINADGSVVVGGVGALDTQVAWAWSLAGGFNSLPDPPGTHGSFASSVSGDGLTVAGTAVTFAGNPTYLSWTWTLAGGYVFPDAFDDLFVTGLSADASTIVGYDTPEPPFSGADTGYYKTTRYGGFTELGIPFLGAFPNTATQVKAVSGDGLTMVGGSGAAPNFGPPFFASAWTIIPPAPPPVSAAPITLPYPPPFAMVCVQPLQICFNKNSHAAGYWYGLRGLGRHNETLN